VLIDNIWYKTYMTGYERGSEIRDIRRSLKLNQRDFAAKVGVTQNTVARWETDKVKPSPLAVARIREIEATIGQPTKAHRKTDS